MAQEDDPQQGNTPSSDNTPASLEPKAAAHMADPESFPQTYIIGSSSDPDSTSVYVQAAAQSRKRAAHMDRQKGIELEVDNMMDEITGDLAEHQEPQREHRARAARRVRFAHHDSTTGQSKQVANTSKAAAKAQQTVSAQGANGANGAQVMHKGAPPLPQVEERAQTNETPAFDTSGTSASAATSLSSGAVMQGFAATNDATTFASGAGTGSGPATSTPNPYDDGKTPRHGHSKRKHHVALIVTCVIVAVVAGVAAFGLWYLHDINSRLKDNLDTNLTNELTETPAGDPFYLLLLGTDKDESRAEGTEYGDSDSAYRSDSIMLVRVDPKNVKVTLVSIHRDTMVDLGDYGTQKINAAYSIGGPSYATEVISDFAGVDISHYAEVDMDRFTDIVDQVGGVTVNLPIAVKDPNYTGLDLEAGEQTLDGHTAALLCRARHAYDAYGDGDRYRAANQRIVMSAVVQKVLASDPATMVSTITTMADSITTDMTLTEILTLAQQMKSLDVSTDVMSGMEPTTSAYINDIWYEIVNEDEWKTMMERVDEGLSPTEGYTDDEMTANVSAGMAGSDSDSSGDSDDDSTDSESATSSSSDSETSSGDSESS